MLKVSGSVASRPAPGSKLAFETPINPMLTRDPVCATVTSLNSR